MKRGHPPSDGSTDFGKRLCALRMAARLNQREMAAQIGVTQSAYARWETRNVSLKPEQIAKAAEVLNVAIADLFTSAKRSQAKTPKRRAS